MHLSLVQVKTEVEEALKNAQEGCATILKTLEDRKE